MRVGCDLSKNINNLILSNYVKINEKRNKSPICIVAFAKI